MSRNLSDYWRIDKSDDWNNELTSILSGAANIVELLDGKYSVQWIGKSFPNTSPKLIGLNADILTGFSAPIPGVIVDVIIGLTIHETGHSKWSVSAEKCSIWSNLYVKDKKELALIHNFLEDAYIDKQLGKISKTLVEYVKSTRHVTCPWKTGGSFSLPDEELSRNILIDAWLAVYFYGMDMFEKASCETRKALLYLIDKTNSYIKEDDSSKRLAMSAITWEWLQQFPGGILKSSRSNIDFKSLIESVVAEYEAVQDDNVAEQVRKTINGGSSMGRLQDLSSYLAKSPKKIKDIDKTEVKLSKRERDITSQLSQIGVSGCVTRIKNAIYDEPSCKIVKEMVLDEIKSVRRVFLRLDTLRTSWRHGLKDGKIDGGRLSKAGVGKKTVFKQCDTRRRPSLAVVLLIDVSSSMLPFMRHVNMAACIFSEALRPLYPRVWNEVVTYTGEGLHAGSDVKLTKLASSTMKLSLKDIWMDGGTPTAEAIASALVMIKKRSNLRKIIIHFTDGYPKDVTKTMVALSQCKKNNVDVITISMDIKNDELYGQGKVLAINEVVELPEAVTKMLSNIYR